MARILCAYSGLSFTCEHFPISLTSGEAWHPIFAVPQKKLFNYLSKWAARELTSTDSYLLFLALLRSSENVEFRVPAQRHEITDSLVANNMQFLAQTVIKLNTVVNPHVIFPKFAITPETKTLLNVHHWIEAWDEEYKSFKAGRISIHESQKLIRREAALEKLIKNPFKDGTQLARALADWAIDAGNFPHGITLVNNKPIKLSEYWREIIVACATTNGLYSIPIKDIKELLEYCEDEVPIGNIFSHKLFHILRTAIEKQANFLGIDKGHTTFEILSEEDSLAVANISAIIQKAPEELPLQSAYPSKIAYLRAKLAYDMAQRMKKKSLKTLTAEDI